MPPGKTLIILGLILVAAGLLLHFSGRIPFLGRLPGDIHIEKENFSFYFPLGSCLLFSLVLSLLFWLFKR
ncbi:MAG: DUF2905 domain-containing protein [Geoalkalibacter sp.]|jgi:hypothetical protein|uniref:DUF2905 domain-containing protein n=1 Tax=Geoalkalibacter sp. TaxID=3041440 RepID=UPI000EC21311|nr:DUF2905 domain-containing protein [Thermodesulfobacteriota bacterium]HCX73154.1 DUF2905 domain-containing protein [Candidatus Cloacimonas sp.]